MLEQALLSAPDDGEGLLVVQQQPHHRGLGDKAANAGAQFLIAGLGQEVVGEAGAVEGVHRPNAVPGSHGAHAGPGHRQIAPFRVPA